MFIRRLIAAAVVVVLSGSGLIASTGAAEARRAPRPTLAAPAQVAAGHSFKVTIQPRHAGRVVLQRKAGSLWRAVAHKHSGGGPVSFRRTEKTAGTVAYRASVGRWSSAVHRVKVRMPRPTDELSISVDSTDDIYVGDTYTVSIEAYRGDTGLAGRPVTVQRLDPGTTTWVAAGAGSYTTDGDGAASFQDSSAKRGLVQYRATSGKLSADTRIPVFQLVTMPGASGLSVQKPPCGAAVSGGDGNVDLTLTSAEKTDSNPACNVDGASVTVTWNLPGGQCVPVQFSGLALTGGSGAHGTLSVDIDGQEISSLSDLGSDVKHVVYGDPMAQLVITMTSKANVDLKASITGAQAVCF